jgi:hypothetical protein
VVEDFFFGATRPPREFATPTIRAARRDDVVPLTDSDQLSKIESPWFDSGALAGSLPPGLHKDRYIDYTERDDDCYYPRALN